MKTRARHTPQCKQGDGSARRATTQPGAPGPVPSPKIFPQDSDGPRRAQPGLRPRGQQRRPGVQNSDGGSALRQAPAGACRGKKTVRARQLAQPTDWDGEADCRGLQAEKPGGSEQKRGEVRWDGRNRAGWHGPNLERLGRGGKTHSEPEDGRDGHMRSRAIKFAVTSSRTFEEPNDTLPLILHLVLVLPWSGEERAAPWSRFGGGLEGRPRRERARPRGPSPHLVSFRIVSFRLVSFRLVSFRFLRLPVDPPPIGEVDREEPYRPRL